MAAGLGFKTFTTGEVLTAADTNGYLMQGINVFASSAARAAAITSPQEGQYSYLKDTNALEYYDGAAWVGAPVGDITAVTAGKGLTGGGSSGDVTISLATTAKGDLVAGSGASTAAVLTVGNNGETLVADSSTATGLAWKSASTQYPWQAWSPIYANLTVGNGTVTARYQQIGKTINVYWKLVWGSTTSLTSYPLIGYPATAAQGEYLMGASSLLDVSAGLFYTGLVYAETGKAYFQPTAQNSAGTYTTNNFLTSSGVPMTWTTGDVMTCTFTYEAA